MGIFDNLERKIASLFPKPEGSDEPLELYREALERIAAKAVQGSRGERLFPYNRVRVELRAGDGERRALLEAVFAQGTLEEAVRQELAAARVRAPEALRVEVVCSAEAEEALRVVCGKSEPAGAGPAAEAPPFAPVRFTVLAGEASEAEFRSEKRFLYVGREEQVRDKEGRLIRRNDLWFVEGGDEASASVSREHAHLEFDGAAGAWRIFDDGSRYGTAIFRGAKRIEVPANSARGTLLRQGDEVYLGEARMRFGD